MIQIVLDFNLIVYFLVTMSYMVRPIASKKHKAAGQRAIKTMLCIMDPCLIHT